MRREGHRQGHDRRRRRSFRVGHALDQRLTEFPVQLSGGRFGSHLLPGADDHLHPGFGPA